MFYWWSTPTKTPKVSWTFQLTYYHHRRVSFFSFENQKSHHWLICKINAHTHYKTITRKTLLCLPFAQFPSHLLCGKPDVGRITGRQSVQLKSFFFLFLPQEGFLLIEMSQKYLSAMIRAYFCATFIICKSPGYNGPFFMARNKIMSLQTSIRPKKLKPWLTIVGMSPHQINMMNSYSY